jgi:hypothetical protein
VAEESRFQGFSKKTVLGVLSIELERLQKIFLESNDANESMRIGTVHAHLRELHEFLSVSETLKDTPNCPVIPLVASIHIEAIEIASLREFLLLAREVAGLPKFE